MFQNAEIGTAQTRDCGKSGKSGSRRSRDSGRCGGLAYRVVIVQSEEEQLIAQNGTAQRSAKPVRIGARVRRLVTVRNTGVGDLLIDGVQIPVLQVVVQSAMKGVGAAFQNRIELPAGRVPVLRAFLILQDVEFSHGVVRAGADQRTSDRFIVVVNAIDHEMVIARTLSADRRTFAGADAAVAGDARTEERQVRHAQPDTADR